MQLERLNRLLLMAGLPWALAVGSGVARADVTKRVEYRRADDGVAAPADRPRQVAAGRLAPSRSDGGGSLHASTVWDIRWATKTRRLADGTCGVIQPTTTLTVVITLPDGDGADPAAIAPASQWRLDRLRSHEDGHLLIAETTARRVDAGLSALPPMADCTALLRAAEQLAGALVKQGSTEQHAYDVLTDHGRWQEAADRQRSPP